MDVVVQGLFGSNLTAVLVVVCYSIDFLVVVYCTGLDIVAGLAQSLVLFSGEQGSVSL